MSVYPLVGCGNCGSHESWMSCRCWCHDKPTGKDKPNV